MYIQTLRLWVFMTFHSQHTLSYLVSMYGLQYQAGYSNNVKTDSLKENFLFLPFYVKEVRGQTQTENSRAELTGLPDTGEPGSSP